MTDQTVTVADAQSGKAVDVAEVTRADGTVVERQRVVLSDVEQPSVHVRVAGEAGHGKAFTTDRDVNEKLAAIHETLIEVRDLLSGLVNS